MSTNHNFRPGEVLRAEQLNDMDAQITDLQNAVTDLSNAVDASVGEVRAAAREAEAMRDQAALYLGAPMVAATAAAMTDKSRIYVYAGSETGYTNGSWYFWNGSAWTVGGVYNAAAVVTDKKLQTANVPADAKAAGVVKSNLRDYNTINVIQSPSPSNKTQYGVSFTWSADGKTCSVEGSATGGAFCSLAGGSAVMPEGLEAGATYIFRYTRTDANIRFGLYWYESKVYKGAILLTGEEQLVTIPSTATAAVILVTVLSGRTVSGTATGFEILTARTNEELESMIAAEQSEREASIRTLAEMGNFNILDYSRIQDVASNGVSFTWNADKSECTVVTQEGGASGDAWCNLYASRLGMRPIPGHTYYFDFESSDTTIRLAFIFYCGGTYRSRSVYRTSGSITIPTTVTVDDTTYEVEEVSVRLLVMINQSGNGTISKLTLKTQSSQQPQQESALIRIMQYNIGKLNMGRQEPGLPDALMDEKVKAYRKLFSSVQADVVGLEEYPIYIDQHYPDIDPEDPDYAWKHYNTDPNGERTSTRETFFSTMFGSYFISRAERAVFTHYPTISSGSGFIVADWPDAPRDEEGNLRGRYYAYIVSKINQRAVVFFSIALGGSVNPIAMQDRVEAMKVLLGLPILNQYDYAFITLDMNNGGDYYPEHPDTWEPTPPYRWDADGQALLEVAQSMGWNFAMGGYYPWEQTYNDVGRPDSFGGAGRPGWRPCLDNIIYKDNGKTRFRGFTILPDVAEDGSRILYSDHYPVYGDFELQ